jgi:hypothetical protein
MPGIVQQSVAATVLPYTLAAAFEETYEWPIVSDGPYADGTENRRLLTVQPLRRWRLSRRVIGSEATTLLAFFAARKGEAFYFYPNPADHDATGTLELGRVKAVFAGALELAWGMPRNAVNFGLEEVR